MPAGVVDVINHRDVVGAIESHRTQQVLVRGDAVRQLSTLLVRLRSENRSTSVESSPDARFGGLPTRRNGAACRVCVAEVET